MVALPGGRLTQHMIQTLIVLQAPLATSLVANPSDKALWHNQQQLIGHTMYNKLPCKIQLFVKNTQGPLEPLEPSKTATNQACPPNISIALKLRGKKLSPMAMRAGLSYNGIESRFRAYENELYS